MNRLDFYNRTVAKSALDLEQLEDRIQKGFHNIEIQLLAADGMGSGLNSEVTNKRLQDWLDVLAKVDVNIVGVHPTLCSSDDPLFASLNAEYCVNVEVWARLSEACRLAQEIAIKQRSRVYVVIHIGESIAQVKRYGFWNELVDKFRSITVMCSMVDLLFENTVVVDKGPEFCNGSTPGDVSQWVAELRESGVRCGMLLDVCHLFMNKQFVEQFADTPFDSCFSKFKEKLSITRTLIGLLGAVHLSSLRNCGVDPNDHGIALEDGCMTSESVYCLMQELIVECGKDTSRKIPWLVLEVREEDYLDARALVKSDIYFKSMIDDIFRTDKI